MPVNGTTVFGNEKAAGLAAETADEDERETRGRE
jgi:hypothetical protein